ncbi:MAG TPA: DUF2171 domain-containing protein [Chloroflexota bacterium]|nr:DUF2171 domain-containing protein [Chloroflexota bacterium]
MCRGPSKLYPRSSMRCPDAADGATFHVGTLQVAGRAEAISRAAWVALTDQGDRTYNVDSLGVFKWLPLLDMVAALELRRAKETTMPRGFSGLAAGLVVRGADAHRVGEVKEVRGGELLIDRRLQPDVLVPIDAVQAISDHEIVLSLTASEVDDLYWTHAGEDIDFDLHGIYIYDYVTPGT